MVFSSLRSAFQSHWKLWEGCFPLRKSPTRKSSLSLGHWVCSAMLSGSSSFTVGVVTQLSYFILFHFPDWDRFVHAKSSQSMVILMGIRTVTKKPDPMTLFQPRARSLFPMVPTAIPFVANDPTP